MFTRLIAALCRAINPATSAPTSTYQSLAQTEDGNHVTSRPGHHSHKFPITPETNTRILHRIDRALMPLMLTTYFLHALDKATLSYTSLFGLLTDTHLRDRQFSYLGSIVFLAQLLFQLPVAWALVKFPIGKFTSAMVLGWGLTLTAMAAAGSFRSLLALRFALGAFEAAVGPAFVAVTQMWWRRREQTFRVGAWYCMNGLSWVFGSLITYVLASIDSTLKPYQIIFLFFGILTVLFAVIMFFHMPDSPNEATFLSLSDKIIAIERLHDNQMGVMTREWRHSQFCETLRDPKTWLWTGMIFCASVPSNGIGVFGPLIIKSFVLDPYQSLLCNIPVGVFHVLAVVGSSWFSMKWKLKGPVIGILCVPPIVGLCILLTYEHNIENKAPLLVGYLCLCTFTGITPLIYSWSSQNTAGDTKHKSTSALVFIGASAGNIIGPLLFTPSEAPSYARGLRANIGFFTAVLCLVGGTTLYLQWLNVAHGQRRVALGKRAIVVDRSLETVENVGIYNSMREDGENNKSLFDGTDLENEDFAFVY